MVQLLGNLLRYSLAHIISLLSRFHHCMSWPQSLLQCTLQALEKKTSKKPLPINKVSISGKRSFFDADVSSDICIILWVAAEHISHTHWVHLNLPSFIQPWLDPCKRHQLDGSLPSVRSPQRSTRCDKKTSREQLHYKKKEKKSARLMHVQKHPCKKEYLLLACC